MDIVPNKIHAQHNYKMIYVIHTFFFYQLYVNNEPVSLPYSDTGNFTLLRDLSSISAILNDASSHLDGTKVTCSTQNGVCVFLVDDWLATSASKGLLVGNIKSWANSDYKVSVIFSFHFLRTFFSDSKRGRLYLFDLPFMSLVNLGIHILIFYRLSAIHVYFNS